MMARNFQEIKKGPNFNVMVADMLEKLKFLSNNTSLKLNFLQEHIEFFPKVRGFTKP